MTYDEAMRVLNGAIYDAVSAGNREGVNTNALREIAADIDHMIDFGCTREEMRNRKIAEGAAKQAGWTA